PRRARVSPGLGSGSCTPTSPRSPQAIPHVPMAVSKRAKSALMPFRNTCPGPKVSCPPDGLLEPAHAASKLLLAGTGESEDEAPPRRRSQIAGGERHRPESPAGRADRDLAIVAHPGGRRHQVHAGVVSENLERVAELLSKGGDERVAPLAVERPRSSEVPREVALADEIGEDGLRERGGKDVGGAADCGETVHEVGGDHDVAQAQRRKEDLAERPDVEDPRVP